MSTLPVQAPSLPKFWSLTVAALSRVAAVAVGLLDSIAEAHHLAEEAQKRYPFFIR